MLHSERILYARAHPLLQPRLARVDVTRLDGVGVEREELPRMADTAQRIPPDRNEARTLALPRRCDEVRREQYLAVDGTAVYLVAPGVGITRHAFTPARTC